MKTKKMHNISLCSSFKVTQPFLVEKLLQWIFKYRLFIKYCVSSFLKLLSYFLLEPDTGCSLNIVFFPKILKYSGLCSPSVSVCVHTRQVEHHRCSRTGIVQKNYNILRKKHNIYWTPCMTQDLSALWRSYREVRTGRESRIYFKKFREKHKI